MAMSNARGTGERKVATTLAEITSTFSYFSNYLRKQSILRAAKPGLAAVSLQEHLKTVSLEILETGS